MTLDACTIDLLHNYGLIQHVKEATHISGNLLDVIVTTDDDAQLVSHVFVEPAYFSDHHTVVCRLNTFNRRPSVMRYGFIDVRRMNMAAFHDDIRKSLLFDFSKRYSIDQYVELFQREITCILDRHVPLKVKTCRVGWNNCRWLSAEARAAKRQCRRVERRFRRTKEAGDKQAYSAARYAARKAVARSRSAYIKE